MAFSHPMAIYATIAALGLWLLTSPLAIVVIVSLVIGLVMVVLFGYTSDQKAIGIAKDQLKAHLLAVRLYRDQIPVVMGSYGKILRGTGRYLKLAFMPLLYVIVPITLLMVQIDRYLGQTPLPVNAPFLMTAHLISGDTLNDVTLDLPPEITMTAPAVHVTDGNEIVWRLAGAKDGKYSVKISIHDQSVGKSRFSSVTICLGFRRFACADNSGAASFPPPSQPFRKIVRLIPSQSIIRIATSTSPATG